MLCHYCEIDDQELLNEYIINNNFIWFMYYDNSINCFRILRRSDHRKILHFKKW